MATMMEKYFKRNEMTLEELYDKIDESIKSKTNVMFVCNYELAEEISEYLDEVYDIIDEYTDLYKDGVDEYYVSLSFFNNEISFDCESARGKNGEFKLNDSEDIVDYYIFLEMSVGEINEKLQGEGTWALYNMTWEDDFEDDEDDDDDPEYLLLEKFADQIMDMNDGLCPSCVMGVVCDIFYAGKNIGSRDNKLEIIEQLSDEIEYLN
jgi:hypothetical protein